MKDFFKLWVGFIIVVVTLAVIGHCVQASAHALARHNYQQELYSG